MLLQVEPDIRFNLTNDLITHEQGCRSGQIIQEPKVNPPLYKEESFLGPMEVRNITAHTESVMMFEPE